MAKVTSLQKSRPAFNPKANYKWEPDDIFEFTGQQLAVLFHCLTKEVNTIEGSTIAQKYESYQVVMDVFKRGVEQGAIVESDDSSNVANIEDSVNRLYDSVNPIE